MGTVSPVLQLHAGLSLAPRIIIHTQLPSRIQLKYSEIKLLIITVFIGKMEIAWYSGALLYITAFVKTC